MDSPDPVNDEVIADSEGEMDEEDHPGDRGMLLSTNMKDIANIVSQVSASTFPGQLHGNSSISAFTAGPSQLNQVSEVENFLGIASIADRAKTRQRIPKSSIQSSLSKPNLMASSTGRLEKKKTDGNISSDIIELSSDDDDELNLRPKPKAKPKHKLKVKDNPRNTSNDNVPGTTETNTDNSTHAIPDSRPRPRPRPLVKRSKPAQESTGPPPLLPPDIPGLLSSPSASVSHGPELPIATSPVRPDLHTSQLPPSDPPLPTPTAIHDENGLPPIEILPNHDDFDGPLSSPSSLFSDFGETTKKRKRTTFNLEIDELASDLDLGPGKGQTSALYHQDDGIAPQVPPHLLPPPSTFFAGSSSSSIGGGDKRLSPQVPSELARDVVDLTMLPPTIQPKKATKKAKILRQKKDDDATRMDEDEFDNDFDPESTTKKGNSKPKPKAKKGGDTVTKAKKGKGRAQVEDSIVSKPRAKKIKEKGKEKATDGDKDTFKSREFIDDSGDDQEPIQLIPLSPGDPGKSESSSSSNQTNKKRKSVIESDLEDHEDEGEKSLKEEKAKRGKNSGNVDGNVEQGDTSITTSTPSKTAQTTLGDRTSPVHLSSSSSIRLNKKRKSVLEDRLEDEDEGEKDQQSIGTSSKKHGYKRGKNGSNVEDQQPAPEEEVAKENVMKLTAKVSKTDERRNTDPALFPSLHSRYEIAPRRSSLPMSELIRRSNSALGSPFSTPQPRTSSSSAARPIKAGTTSYSPYLKSSRSVLSRIAPLHPNRRTPPTPLPPPPLKKKTKKELELEEKWEEEMIDSVGGISEWTCLTDDEKKELKRAKWAREMGDWED